MKYKSQVSGKLYTKVNEDVVALEDGCGNIIYVVESSLENSFDKVPDYKFEIGDYVTKLNGEVIFAVLTKKIDEAGNLTYRLRGLTEEGHVFYTDYVREYELKLVRRKDSRW